MSTIQVRNVPEDLHRRLKARAAENGRTLSDYLLDELASIADRPTMRQWLETTRTLPTPLKEPTPAAEILAAERRR